MATHFERINITLPPALATRFRAYCRRKGMCVSRRIAILIEQEMAKDKSQVGGP
jgi:hypothetical protein